VAVPSFNTGAWYDIFLQGTIDNYIAASRHGPGARLIVGPWAHERFADPIGQSVFGIHATMDGAPVHPHGTWSDFQLAWLRRRLVPGSRTIASMAGKLVRRRALRRRRAARSRRPSPPCHWRR
jgi:uncharacterized protein